MEQWGILIKKLREEMGLTSLELATKAGLKPSTLRSWEVGHAKEYKANSLVKLAKGFGISKLAIEDYLKTGNVSSIIKKEIVAIPSGTPDLWNKFNSNSGNLLKVPVYPDYIQVHAGEVLNVIDYIYLDKPTTAPFTLKAYRVNGDCLEPELKDGDYVIVDHDRQIDNGDKVVCIFDNQLHVTKLKVIGGEFWLENRYGTHKMTDCQGIAKVVGSYRKYT